MAKDPAFLFYPNDWLGGTLGMTFEEKGAYMELLMLQFNRGHMDGHMIGQVVGQIWVKLQDKFVQDADGLWYNERLEEEQNRRKAFSISRRNNLSGKNQHSKRGHKTKHMRGHMTSHMENENENENRNINNNKEGIIRFEEIEVAQVFHPVTDFLQKNCPTVRKLKEQMTIDQADQLMREYSLKEITDVLEAMENWVPLTKKSKSVYLTAKNWLRRKTTTDGKSKSSFTKSAQEWFDRTSQTGFSGS
jgi:uncharacterized protein YdaU (DUF1376 family)